MPPLSVDASAAARPAFRHTRVALGCVAALATAGCDPCSTTVGCSGSPVVAVVGQIVEDGTGVAMRNVRIDLVRQSGVALQSPTASTTTQANGTFALELPAGDTGEALVTLTVSTRGQPPYSIPDVRLRATTATGSATVLPPWVSANPTIPYVLIVRPDPDKEAGLANALVEFRRTAGPLLLSNGIPVASVKGKTDAWGWVYLFREVKAEGGGAITGDLVVHSPVTSDSVVITQVSLKVSPRFEQPTWIAVYGVGPL